MQPDDVGAIINVAKTYKNMNMTKEAEKWFYHAIDLIPSSINRRDSEGDGQKKGYETKMNPNYLFAFISLANMIKEDPNRIEEADRVRCDL